jgi:hypothetical protein
MTRELTELKLPKSGATAHLVTYFSRREASHITKAMWDFTKYTIDPKTQAPKIESVDMSYQTEQQNRELRHGVKKLVFNDKEVEESKLYDAVLDLPDSDVKLILQKLSSAWEDVTASEVEKKSPSKTSQSKSSS